MEEGIAFRSFVQKDKNIRTYSGVKGWPNQWGAGWIGYIRIYEEGGNEIDHLFHAGTGRFTEAYVVVHSVKRSEEGAEVTVTALPDPERRQFYRTK